MQHDDNYLDAKEELLDRIEDEINTAIEDVLADTLMKLEGIDEDDDTAREAALVPLNDTLQSVIGQTLFLHQREMSELATRFYAGTMAPMQTPQDFLDTIKIRGVTLTDLFRRRSPSRFMADILKATPPELVHTVRSAIQHAVWSSAAMAEEFSWTSTSLLMWITRPELSATGTCNECSPLNGRKEKRRADFGVPYPVHPRCKCGIVPVTS